MNNPDNLPNARAGTTRDDAPLLAVPHPADHPQQIGRYRIDKVLGEGGFGLVYLAHDDQLNRAVAIKVPRHQGRSHHEAESFLAEARILASLDHPNIVPIFDFGTTPDGLCYVVSKLIEGCDLATRIKECPSPFGPIADLVATVAEALHYAHRKGLVHRDIKPDNILINPAGKPFVADFGLALKEADFGKGPTFAGTPAYMSPEQARGEGHRVDGRSDIFSLGVVFYELLVGRRPFKADSQQDLREQVTAVEARPPRQVDDHIPKELERICLKALAKRASERYTTAKDMADDLRHFLEAASAEEMSTVGFKPIGEGRASTPFLHAVPTPVSDQRPIQIVPKGLRSFDAHDSDFFLELLPGPRDRDGLPDSIRFWKTQIEEMNADNTFSVGLIYGPSGCGKSSLVKAGLLPRLSDGVITVYVEATTEETETRLLNGLRNRFPALSDNDSLKETLAALRRGQGIPANLKVLIVLDQFEQWLHAKKEETNTELVQALRQCDGGRVQCIVMVRDDFWLAVSRFVRDLEVDLVPGCNIALVDLFDLDHARKVLAAFGRAFNKLPESSRDTTKDQKEFLNQALSGLTQEGKIICVRLALFAEMMKSKAWTPASLKAVGGTEGVGVTFLEETFSSSIANPKHRYHQKAARDVLKALLPETGSDIKGTMRSYAELLEVSDYASRPKDFDDLIHILDSETRLITPTDPDGKEDASACSKDGKKYYQLTHDYLVHSLRAWLTRKQKETRRGRAELLLVDRAAVWNTRPENRQLPSLLQWLQIRSLTTRKNWTPQQRKMMKRAGTRHALRGLVLALLLALATVTGLGIREQVVEQRKALQAEELVKAVLSADTVKVPRIIEGMADRRKWTDPLLREAYDKAEDKSREKLHASLALLPVDDTQVAYLQGRLLDAEPQEEVPVIRDALAPRKNALLDKLWAVVEKPEKGKEAQRLRAAAALAKYNPESSRWDKAGDLVVNDLVLENPIFLGQWSEAFRPVKSRLLPRLSEIFRDHRPGHSAERSLATNILADYAADQLQVLVDLLMDADEKQFAVIYPKFKEYGEQGLPALTAEIDRKLPPDLPYSDDRREKLAKRQANAAVALLRMNQPAKVWPLLQHSHDPRVRSYLIHRLYPLGADVQAIVNRLNKEPDVTIRRALLLSLGEFGEKELSQEDRKTLLPKLQEMYCTASDPGLHAASEWLLRTWKQETWLKQINDEWAKDKEQRETRLEGIGKLLAKDKEQTPPQWYVSCQGQTMVVIPGPVEFLMGSPSNEDKRREDELQHKKRITRTFAIASKAVTKDQFLSFQPRFTHTEMGRYPAPACPIGGVIWYEATAYCNWISDKEGIPRDQWCYETDQQGQVTKLKKNYLSLTGYRLPTEAEIEYATRAEAWTSRSYGETEELLPRYAWYTRNAQEKTWPVGSLKPNDFGLFDVHGNVYGWCQESYRRYPTLRDGETCEDKEDTLIVDATYSRVLRGGSFGFVSSDARSAARISLVPENRGIVGIGFRLARTITP